MTPEGESFNRFFDVAESGVDSGTSFHSPKAKHLYDWWRASGHGGLPSRSMFDILDHKLIIRNVFLIEVRSDGAFLFRLLGDAVIEILGRNRTGEIVRGDEPGYGYPLDALYRRIVETKTCRRCVGSLAVADGGLRRFESVNCPLSSDGGETIDMIIGIMDFIDDMKSD